MQQPAGSEVPLAASPDRACWRQGLCQFVIGLVSIRGDLDNPKPALSLQPAGSGPNNFGDSVLCRGLKLDLVSGTQHQSGVDGTKAPFADVPELAGNAPAGAK